MKVFISGTGLVSSLGNRATTAFEALLRHESAIRAYPEWEQYKGLHSRLGAPAHPFDIKSVPRSSRRTMSRMSEMAARAALDALEDAGISPEAINQEFPRTLICMGSTSGSPDTLETYFKKLLEVGGPEGQLGTSFFKVMNHSISTNVAAALGFTGPALGVASACSTSTQAIILGWELIRAGVYDRVIAGGADELHYTSAAVFDTVHAATRNFNDRADQSPRPFDRDRDGLAVSEGASVIILESERSLQKRGQKARAEIRGGAYVCEGSHASQSNREAMVKTMRLSLERSELGPADIDYVNAHATGTIQGDAEEAQAIADTFGSRTPVSSLKGHFGHSLAACGGIEVIMSMEMMGHGTLIPTKNLENIDSTCAGANLIKEPLRLPIKNVLSNNFAFGGMCTSLILSKVD